MWRATRSTACTQKRIAQQIEPDGKMPRELERTRALHYSVFALQAAAGIADLARCVGKDVWNSKTADGRGLRVAIDFLLPYVGRESEFPYPDLKREPSEQAFELFSTGGVGVSQTGIRARSGRAGAVQAGQRHQSDDRTSAVTCSTIGSHVAVPHRHKNFVCRDSCRRKESDAN